MPRRCRGIRGDVGIAPYERSIEDASAKRRAELPRPYGRLSAALCCMREKQNGYPFGYPLSLVHQPMLFSFSVSALFLWAALFLCSRPLAAALSIALTATL